jgi:ribose transport system permease protein
MTQDPAGTAGAVTSPGPPPPPAASAHQVSRASRAFDFLAEYAVLVLLVGIFIWLTFASDAFLSTRNIVNILNQNAPLAIIACAGTLVVIGGGFDLSTGAIVGVASVTAAWLAVNVDPYLGLIVAPFVGMALGLGNGIIIVAFKIHSFLATLATSLVYSGAALFITGGFLIAVSASEFTVLGRGRFLDVNYAVFVFLAFAAVCWIILEATPLGRYVYALGGNEEAAELSGVRTHRVRIATFVLSGLAAGFAGAIIVSRIASGQPQTGEGMALQAIAAVILGGTSIYGGAGAVWRSIAGVYLLALIGNGFNILNVDPFIKDVVTGLIIIAAVGLSAARGRRR